MPSTAIDRRRSLGWLAALLAAPLLAPLGAQAAPRPLFLSARGDGQGRYFVSGFDRDGRPAFDLALPGRGHAVVPRPGPPHSQGQAVVFARRPGGFALVLDLEAGRVLQRLDSAEGRHFYGHGVFSQDGRTLFSSENAYETGRGVIGIRDATDGYRRLGEYPSYETGPHDLRLLGDGKTLVVANGGILTHPESGRAKLNLPEMSPSLAYLDLADGRLRADYRLPAEHHRLSIRHLVVGPDDQVAIALQYEGPRSDLPPLVALHRGQDAIALLAAPEPVQRRMRNYCGSLALDSAGEVLAVSSPRGGLITFWALGEGRFLGSTALPDGCGVAPAAAPGTFLLTSGRGDRAVFDVARETVSPIAAGFGPGVQWDNHLTAWPRI